MNVIDADLSHVKYLSDFGRKSFIHAYQCTLPLEELNKYISDAFSESTILAEIKSLLGTYLVAQDSKLNLCGYAKLIESPSPKCIGLHRCIELQRLYVDDDYRGQGVGRLLESHAEVIARGRGMQGLWLQVWEGNVVAQDIYKRWAFSTVGEKQYQVGENQRTVLLMRKLWVSR